MKNHITLQAKRRKRSPYTPMYHQPLTQRFGKFYIHSHEPKIEIRVTNSTSTPFAIKKNTVIAEFKLMSPEVAEEIKPLNRAA